MNYRAEIDGLRAICVLSVILYHAEFMILGQDWFQGGYIGVDIFFVISGYLIARIILTELKETNSINFKIFYERRARRILPMLVLIIAVFLPFAWHKLLPLDLVEYTQSALSALAFGSNLFFYFATTQYGAESSLLKPLLHTWSLGVEEQFYLFAPAVLLVIWKIKKEFLIPILIIAILLSLQFSELMSTRYTSLNFFLPFSRAWELLLGGLIAHVEIKYHLRKYKFLNQGMTIIGLALIVLSLFIFKSSTPHPGYYTFLPVLGAGLIIAFSTQEDLVGKCLSFKPLIGLGLISYSLYLWHYPIFAFSRMGSLEPTNLDKMGWVAITIVLSIASYFMIERPFRNKTLFTSKRFIIIILSSIALLGSINFYIMKNEGFTHRFPPIFSKDISQNTVELYKQDGVPCFGREKDFCEEFVSENAINLIAIGDSHISSISTQLLEQVKGQFNYIEAHVGGCPFVYGLRKFYKEKPTVECQESLQSKRLEIIPTEPSIVLIGGYYPMYLDNKSFYTTSSLLDFRSEEGLSVTESFSNTVEKLLKKGHRLILIYPIPQAKQHVPRYIFDEYKKVNSIPDIQTWWNNLTPLTTDLSYFWERAENTFELFDRFQSDNIFRVYPHEAFCDNQIKGKCVAYSDRDVFYFDNNHPSAVGAEMIVELIMPELLKAQASILEQKNK